MRILLLFLFIFLVSFCFFSCVTLNTDNDNVIVLNEDVLNEFKINEKEAIKKYNNKKIQVNAIFSSHSPTAGLGILFFMPLKPAIAVLIDNECLYRFFGWHIFKEVNRSRIYQGDIAILEGTFKGSYKRGNLKYYNGLKGSFIEEEMCVFEFKNSKVIRKIE